MGVAAAQPHCQGARSETARFCHGHLRNLSVRDADRSRPSPLLETCGAETDTGLL